MMCEHCHHHHMISLLPVMSFYCEMSIQLLPSLLITVFLLNSQGTLYILDQSPLSTVLQIISSVLWFAFFVFCGVLYKSKSFINLNN